VTTNSVEIVRIYEALARLDALPTTPEREAERVRKQTRLRRLQHIDANREQRVDLARERFDPVAARAALTRAKELIERHS